MSLHLCSLANISVRKNITKDHVMHWMEYFIISMIADLPDR